MFTSPLPKYLGVVVNVDGGLSVACEVGSASSFRLGVTFAPDQGGGFSALPSPSLDSARTLPAFSKVTTPHGVGIKTAFGSLVATNAGVWTLADGAGNVVLQADGPPTLNPAGDGTVVSKVLNASGTGPGSVGAPCLSNGGFGPPYVRLPPATPRICSLGMMGCFVSTLSGAVAGSVRFLLTCASLDDVIAVTPGTL